MIIIPMAGLSSRFYKAGYTVPKYELLWKNKTVFEHSVLSFKKYFLTDEFLFIVKKNQNATQFITTITKKLEILKIKIVELERDTLGQADTVFQGLLSEPNQPIIIFNIDTFLLDFKKPKWINQCDGYLEVFKGEGEHWSFVEPGKDFNVLKTTEKDRISDLCSNGVYYFKSSNVFKSIVNKNISEERYVKGELYIAPMYNEIINFNGSIKYNKVNVGSIRFCGTPKEYRGLLNEK